MLLPIKIAVRFLKSSKGQTILITLGIAIGVSVQIFIGLLIQGLQYSLIDKTIGTSSHITITSNVDNKTITDYQGIMSDIGNSDSNIKYISASLDRPAFITIDDNTQSILIRGLTFPEANNIYRIEQSLIEGAMPNDNNVLIGKSLMEALELEVGDSIDITIPNIGIKSLVISGVFDLKVAVVNNTWFITNLATAQQIYEVGDIVSSIEMQITDVFSSDILAQGIKALVNTNYNVVDWQSANEELLSGLNGQSVSSIIIQVFVIIAVVLGIASVLAISVLQKSKQIGILKAMGIKDRASSIIFLTQGIILGCLGAIVGIAIGLGLSLAFTSFALNPDGTPLIPLLINYNFILLSGAIAIVASMLASMIPAVRSLRMDPIEVIKNG